jgi:hypothetical protein
MRCFQSENTDMKNERAAMDVQWLDEVGLHQAVVGGDPEAFAELIRRFDPLVRAQLSPATPDEQVEAEMAEVWIALIRDPRLRAWEAAWGGLLADWVSMLAAQASSARQRAERAS